MLELLDLLLRGDLALQVAGQAGQLLRLQVAVGGDGGQLARA